MPAQANLEHGQSPAGPAPADLARAAHAGNDSGRLRPRRLPRRMSVLGIGIGQLIACQLIAVVGVVALTRHGHAGWALGALGLLGLLLTVTRWRHRWAYQWLATAWGFSNACTAPSIDVISVRIRGGTEVGVVHDGEGFAAIVAVAPQRGRPTIPRLPVAKLAGLLEAQDPLVSSVQVIVHSDLAATDAASQPISGYRNLGYHRVPRSVSTWISLRHDPRASGCAPAVIGTPLELHTSLVRALANRGVRAAGVIADLGLHGHLVDARGARGVVDSLLVADPGRRPAAEAKSRPSHQWKSWCGPTRSHVTYWLRRWPAAGIDALLQALATVPALSVTTAIVVARAADGQARLTATVRVAIAPGAAESASTKAVARAAASCGARLTRMNGDHAAGVLATLPLGRAPVTSARWIGWHAVQDDGSLAPVVPVTPGGVVIGTDSGGQPVPVPLFAGTAGARLAVIGDPLLARLLALRALATGARLQIVTAQPASWMRFRRYASLTSEHMVVARPGAEPPSGGTGAAPWLVIDESGLPNTAGSRPWQALVTLPGTVSSPEVALSHLDTILLHRCSAGDAAAVAAALGLPAASVHALQMVPTGCVAVALRGSVRFARLSMDQAERAVLAESMQPG